MMQRQDLHTAEISASRCVRFHHPTHGNSRSIWVGVRGMNVMVATVDKSYTAEWHDALNQLVLSSCDDGSARLMGHQRKGMSPGDWAALQCATQWAVSSILRAYVVPLVGRAEWSHIEPLTARTTWHDLMRPEDQRDDDIQSETLPFEWNRAPGNV